LQAGGSVSSLPAHYHAIADCSGHVASECSVNRMFANFADLGITEMTAEDAWKLMEEADKEKDVDDIKKVSLTYLYVDYR